MISDLHRQVISCKRIIQRSKRYNQYGKIVCKSKIGSIKIDPVNGEQFRVKVDVAVSNVFYGWVFGFGGKVKIEAPVDVKEEYKQMVKAASAEV